VSGEETHRRETAKGLRRKPRHLKVLEANPETGGEAGAGDELGGTTAKDPLGDELEILGGNLAIAVSIDRLGDVLLDLLPADGDIAEVGENLKEDNGHTNVVGDLLLNLLDVDPGAKAENGGRGDLPSKVSRDTSRAALLAVKGSKRSISSALSRLSTGGSGRGGGGSDLLLLVAYNKETKVYIQGLGSRDGSGSES